MKIFYQYKMFYQYKKIYGVCNAEIYTYGYVLSDITLNFLTDIILNII